MKIHTAEKKYSDKLLNIQFMRSRSYSDVDGDSCGSDFDDNMGCLWIILVLLSPSLPVSTKFQLTLLLIAPQSFLLYGKHFLIWRYKTSAADTVMCNK